MPASLMAQLRYDQGRLDEAEALVSDRLAAIEAASMLECVLAAYLVLARVALHRGHIDRAEALLDQGERLGRTRHWDRLVACMILERGRIGLAAGRLVEVEASVAQLEQLSRLNPAPTRCAWSEIYDGAAMARADLLGAHGHHAESAIILRRLYGEARSGKRHAPALKLALQLATQLYRNHEPAEAFILCREAGRAAAIAGLPQPLHDAPPDISLLLRRVQDELQSEAGPRGLRQAAVLAWDGQALALSGAGRATLAPANIEPLSQRELGVLALLVAGRSNKDIARDLNIAPETVKSHVKGIFAKLGVACRAQAVSRAFSLGLVSSGIR